jgi:hypothetical protein
MLADQVKQNGRAKASSILFVLFLIPYLGLNGFPGRGNQRPLVIHSLTIGRTSCRISTEEIEGPTVIGDLQRTVFTCDRAKQALDNTRACSRSTGCGQRLPFCVSLLKM